MPRASVGINPALLPLCVIGHRQDGLAAARQISVAEESPRSDVAESPFVVDEPSQPGPSRSTSVELPAGSGREVGGRPAAERGPAYGRPHAGRTSALLPDGGRSRENEVDGGRSSEVGETRRQMSPPPPPPPASTDDDGDTSTAPTYRREFVYILGHIACMQCVTDAAAYCHRSVSLSVCRPGPSLSMRIAIRHGTRSHFATQRPNDPGIQRPGDPVDPVTLFYNELQMSSYVLGCAKNF